MRAPKEKNPLLPDLIGSARLRGPRGDARRARVVGLGEVAQLVAPEALVGARPRHLEGDVVRRAAPRLTPERVRAPARGERQPIVQLRRLAGKW